MIPLPHPISHHMHPPACTFLPWRAPTVPLPPRVPFPGRTPHQAPPSHHDHMPLLTCPWFDQAGARRACPTPAPPAPSICSPPLLTPPHLPFNTQPSALIDCAVCCACTPAAWFCGCLAGAPFWRPAPLLSAVAPQLSLLPLAPPSPAATAHSRMATVCVALFEVFILYRFLRRPCRQESVGRRRMLRGKWLKGGTACRRRRGSARWSRCGAGAATKQAHICRHCRRILCCASNSCTGHCECG